MKDRIFTKFCGINSEDAIISAQNAGCDALGFVFVKTSKRYISSERYSELERSVSPMMLKVALFSNNSEQEVEKVLNSGSFNVIQFHGSEAPEFCQQWQMPYWKAIPMLDDIVLSDWINKYASANGFVLDHFGEKSMAGSGECFDWSDIPRNSSYHWILAGGLSPENIREAIRETGLRHYDVSSGIESSPGVKSEQLMNNFIMEIRSSISEQ